ncbi:cupin domain-containing protein [Streptomyces sp. NBC_01241]|uniref:cupin domain-containing protein n=1 Tax=Streptomyces sp. NBC_01241 TaxID=2903794 RepID=UPI00352E8E00
MTPPIDRIFPCSAHDPSTRPRPPSARGRVRRGRVRRGGSEPFLRIVRRCWSPPRVDRTFRSSSCSVSRCSARRSSTPRRWTNPTTRPSGNLLFSGHEQGRIEIYRTRLHPQARSQVGSHGADSVEYVLVMSGRVTLVVNDVPHLLEAGDTARFSGLSSHYYTTEDSPAVTHTIVGYPRDCPVRAAAPSRAAIDFDSTTAGYASIGPHCTVGCGSLETTAPPGSPVPVGRFCCPARPTSVRTRRPITAIAGHYCGVT